jgi:hypothetical protein
LKAERDLSFHVGKFLLHQLRRRQRTVELLAVQQTSLNLRLV